jgi:hypothetical protein
LWVESSYGRGAAAQLCNRYKGNFKQGMRDGIGVFFYSTGARYAGQWAGNVKHGEGSFTFEDGSVYEGLFHNDRCDALQRCTSCESQRLRFGTGQDKEMGSTSGPSDYRAEGSNKFNMAKSKLRQLVRLPLGCGQLSVGGEVTNRVTIK